MWLSFITAGRGGLGVKIKDGPTPHNSRRASHCTSVLQRLERGGTFTVVKQNIMQVFIHMELHSAFVLINNVNCSVDDLKHWGCETDFMPVELKSVEDVWSACVQSTHIDCN